MPDDPTKLKRIM
jgi:phosphoglycerate kinase